MTKTAEESQEEKKSVTPEPEKTQKKIKDSDYFVITVPKFRLKETPLAPLWVFLLLLFSFLLGMLTTKVQYLQMEKKQEALPTTNAAAAQQVRQKPQITDETIKKWAKDIGLNTGQFNQCYDNQKYAGNIETDVADASEADAQATPTFYINGVQLVGAQPFSVFKKAIDDELNGTVDTTAETYTVETGTLPVLGNQNAPVKIIEFSDFECPFCLRFYTDTYSKIKKEYVDTGKVAFYYRHLPLPMHSMAESMAQASECANEQGKFWQMHDKIFEGQKA